MVAGVGLSFFRRSLFMSSVSIAVFLACKINPFDSKLTDLVFMLLLLLFFTADGITYSFGVIYVKLDEFNEGKGYTSVILSLLTGMTLLTGIETGLKTDINFIQLIRK